MIIDLPFADRYPRLFQAGKLASVVLSSVILGIALYASKVIIDGALRTDLAWLSLLGTILVLISVGIGGYRQFCMLVAKGIYGRINIPEVWRSEIFRLASLGMVAYLSLVGSYAISLGLEQILPMLIAHLLFYPILLIRWMASLAIGVALKRRDDMIDLTGHDEKARNADTHTQKK